MKKSTLVGRAVAFIACCIVSLAGARSASASTLGDLAASMQPGTWAEVTSMGNWDSGGILVPGFGCTPSDYITQYAEKAAWDPVGRRLLFIGQAHGNCYGGNFVLFSEASHSWSIGPYPPGICQSGTASSPCFNHAYDHNTVDPATGDLYYRNYASKKFFRYHNGSWSTIAPPSDMDNVQDSGALEFFPEMNRLIFVDGDWGMWSWNPANSQWTRIADTNVNVSPSLPNMPMIPYNNFGLYNPVLKIFLFGGGSTNLYKMSSSGTFTTLKTPPVALGVTKALVSVDPVSGKYIVLSGSSMYQYDAAADVWTRLSTTIPGTLTALDGVGDGLITAPIAAHGVMIFVKYNFGSSKVYLYKHAPARVPEAPTSLSVR